ncbi:hypothetical protein VHARVF571_260060 [Vibrio harveyi]|nr:hypothetical protein VHARVF571_260060 [Vibrio harveyi]
MLNHFAGFSPTDIGLGTKSMRSEHFPDSDNILYVRLNISSFIAQFLACGPYTLTRNDFRSCFSSIDKDISLPFNCI